MVVHSYKTNKAIEKPLQPRSYIRMLRQAAKKAASVFEYGQVYMARKQLGRMLRRKKRG